MIVTLSDAINAMGDRIEPAGAWTQCALAKDAFGNEIAPTAPEATCWCVEGALISLRPGARSESIITALITKPLGVETLWTWNDASWNTQKNIVKHLRLVARDDRANEPFVITAPAPVMSRF